MVLEVKSEGMERKSEWRGRRQQRRSYRVSGQPRAAEVPTNMDVQPIYPFSR